VAGEHEPWAAPGAVGGTLIPWLSAAQCCGAVAVLGIFLTMVTPVARTVLLPESNSSAAASGAVFRSRQLSWYEVLWGVQTPQIPLFLQKSRVCEV